MINQAIYRQRGHRGRTAKIIKHKWRYISKGERIRIVASGDIFIGTIDVPSRKLYIGK